MRVTADGISHTFPGTGELFAGLSFTLSAGELVGIVGPSGSGKSTLLSLLAGWERPVAGSIQWEDIRSVAWVFQNPYGVYGRSAIDHVVVPLLAQGFRRKNALIRAKALLERFGLGALADRKYSNLSGGEAQRLMLARAIAKGADLLLVDEPTAQLDPASSETVNDVLGELAGEQRIVVVATHDPDTAASCGRVVDLHQAWEASHET